MAKKSLFSIIANESLSNGKQYEVSISGINEYSYQQSQKSTTLRNDCSITDLVVYT